MKTQWYAVYFKGRNEKKVAEILTRKKIENYFPLSKVVENWSVDNKYVDQPVFASYIFVRTTEKQILSLKKLPIVINLVYWLGKPVVITDTEINTLKRFLDDHVNVKVEKLTLGKGMVRKINASVIEEESLFKIINQSINIVLPSLGYRITAEETSNVRIISSDTLVHKSTLKSSKFNPVQIFNNF